MKRTKRARRPAPAGFTLVELMVVISIIAILATIVGYNVFNQIDTAGVGAAQAQIKNFKTAIVAFRLEFHRLPSSLEELINNPKGKNFLDSDKLPVDPWGNPYQYQASGREFTIVSYGADGKPGGTDVDADISSASLAQSN